MEHMKLLTERLGAVAITLVFASSAMGWQAAKPDTLQRADGKSVPGTFQGNAKAGFTFNPADGSPAIAVDGPAVVAFGGEGPGPTASVPPLKVILGLGQLLSGQLTSLDDETITLAEGPGGRQVKVARIGALGVRQRPGEALVLIDGFEKLDSKRWSIVGSPQLSTDIHFAGTHGLKLPADGAAITHKLAEPVGQGRFEIAVYDVPATIPGVQWFVDLLFRGERGPESVRAVLGWSEESLAVQTTGTMSLAVQRLARKPGWHRLEVRFGADATEMSFDGNSLAHGKGTTGPLVEIRVGTSVTEKLSERGLAAYIDELRDCGVIARSRSQPGRVASR